MSLLKRRRCKFLSILIVDTRRTHPRHPNKAPISSELKVTNTLHFQIPKVSLAGVAAQVTHSAKIAKACKSLQKLQKPL
jgi:hypothetical protein